MRRVVITGMGIVSSIGSDVREVTAALREGRSGIVFAPEYAERGFRCQVHGKPAADIAGLVDKRVRRFMGEGAAWNYIAMNQAIADAGLTEAEVSNERTGLIMGSGGPSTHALFEANQSVLEKATTRRIGPFAVPKAMSSTNSATLATPFKIKGVNYSITSACSTSGHCIGNGVEQIQWGKQDIVFAGGGEDLDWTLSCLFDAMGAMSSKFNDTPERASRAYDKDRDGFVIAGGAGVVVLEELERARDRGAGGDLLHPDVAGRFCRRQRQCREHGPGIRGRAGGNHPARRCRARHRDLEQLRIRRHQLHTGAEPVSRVRT